MPESLVIARDTFWDVGPPFSYYDLIQITKSDEGLALDQVLVTPPGQACIQPATVEERAAVLHETMDELLTGRNPCAISDKDLHREIKRCKKCLVFSGVHVTMQARCEGKDRQLRMDILDRDIYDKRTQTPTNTSWSMRLLSQLNDSLGPGSEEKPIFQLGVAAHHDVPGTPLVRAIQDGKFDGLFGKEQGVSGIARAANDPPPPPPSVAIETVGPIAPNSPQLPKYYPPIAKAARVEGLVTVTFDVSLDGKVQNVLMIDGPRLLESTVKDTVSSWSFPQTAWGKSGRAGIRFNLNCKAGAS